MTFFLAFCCTILFVIAIACQLGVKLTRLAHKAGTFLQKSVTKEKATRSAPDCLHIKPVVDIEAADHVPGRQQHK